MVKLKMIIKILDAFIWVNANYQVSKERPHQGTHRFDWFDQHFSNLSGQTTIDIGKFQFKVKK